MAHFLNGRRVVTLLAVAAVALVLWQVRSWFPRPTEPPYRFVGSWGAEGPDGLVAPIGIAVAGHEVYVSDAGTGRIRVFDTEGRSLRSFGREGKDPGELGRPMHIEFRRGRLYVAESLNDRIQVFSPEGESLAIFGRSGAGPGEFDAPAGVAAGREGRLYVADFYNQRAQILDADGQFLAQVSDTKKKGILGGQFNYPTDVAVLPDGGFVVADAYNDRVQVFTASGEFVRKWGGPLAMNLRGSAYAWFRTATGVATDAAGHVFVADFENHRIQKFSSRGRFLTAFGGPGAGPGQFDRPTDVVVDESGNVYVVDHGHRRIQKFAPAS